MKNIATSIVFFLVLQNIFAQEISDTIQIKKILLGTVFQMNGKNLKPNQLIDITKSNPEAYSVMKIARTNFNMGMIFMFAGGILFYYSLGTLVYTDSPNWTPAAIGAGLVIVSIPFGMSYVNHAKTAVKIYNNSLGYSYNSNPIMRLCVTNNGIGLKVIF